MNIRWLSVSTIAVGIFLSMLSEIRDSSDGGLQSYDLVQEK